MKTSTSLRGSSATRKFNFPQDCLAGQATAEMSTLTPEYRALIDAARENPNRSFIKVRRTAEKAAIGVSTVWRDVKRGVFVPPVRISGRHVAWVEAEVDALLAAKTMMARSGAKICLAQFVVELIAA